MNTAIVMEPQAKVKNARFVAPLSEYDQGRKLYRAGKPLRECVTDEMTAGWLDAEAAGADAYWRAMMLEAN
jgi:hypothetical protein